MSDFNQLLGYEQRDNRRLSERDDVEQYLPVATAEPKSPYLKAAIVAVLCFGGTAAAFGTYRLLTGDPPQMSDRQEEVAEESSDVTQLHPPELPPAESSGTMTRLAVSEQDRQLSEIEPLPEEPEEVEESPPEPSPAIAEGQPEPRPAPTPDPMQVLQQVTALGSYGQISEPPFLAADTEAAIAGEPVDTSPSDSQHWLTGQVTSQPARPPESELQIDVELERSYFEGTGTRSIASGTMAEGQIAAPVVWSPASSEGTAERFVIRLDSPLHDTDGLPAVPSGSEVVVQVDGIDPNGYVRMSGVALVVNLDGREEIPLAPGILTVRGDGGQPLLAQGDPRLDAGPDIASQEAGLFVLGAFGEVGRLLNRPSSVTSASTVSGFGGATFSQETNDGTNILGGVLAGGADAVIPGMQQRTQRSIDEAMERERLWVVQAGQPVMVVVNREVRL
ncbi:MAG: hypothetical protein AAF974_00045 [Cyanobacteria bacterium P01_E01_bin.34]